MLSVQTLEFSAADAAAAQEWAKRIAETSKEPLVTLDNDLNCPRLLLLVAASETPYSERNVWIEAEISEAVDVVRTGRPAFCSVWKESRFEKVDAIDGSLLIASLEKAWGLFLAAWRRAPVELAQFEAELDAEFAGSSGPTDLHPPSWN
ncbi:MAG: hypothetical protein RIC55_07995 [Pirellulaceae bacterium]